MRNKKEHLIKIQENKSKQNLNFRRFKDKIKDLQVNWEVLDRFLRLRDLVKQINNSVRFKEVQNLFNKHLNHHSML